MLLALGVPILLFGSFLFIANILHHDEGVPDDTKLLLSAVNVSESENAITSLGRASAALEEIDSFSAYTNDQLPKIRQIISGEVVDAEYADALVKKFSSVITEFTAATKKSVYQSKFGTDPNHLDYKDLTSLSGVQFIARLVGVAALQQANSGKIDQALTSAVGIAKVGHMMELGQGTVIEYLVGSAVKTIGLDTIRTISRQHPISNTTSKKISTELELYRDSREGAIRSLKLEYASSKTFLQKIQTPHNFLDEQGGITYDENGNEMPNPRSITSRFVQVFDELDFTKYYYFPNQTLRYLVEDRLTDIAYAQQPCSTYVEQPERPTRAKRHGIGLILEPNAIGRVISSIGSTVLGGIGRMTCYDELGVRAAQSSLAISAYKVDHTKQLPSSLDALIPNYLSSVPIDPFSGNVLIYYQQNKILYSVGEDHTDTGGSPTTENIREAKDPSFAL
jgi:hypothetical protein